jgi:class I fructose-bisphosphate aldolase
MPLVVWSYPRGAAINQKGGRDSFYAVDYAARLAMELGADIVKVNFPKPSDKDKDAPAPYNELKPSEVEAFSQVVQSAGNAFVLVSGGSKVSDDDLLEKVRWSMEAGATGLIFGRNMWQRPMDEALALTEKVKAIIAAS